MSNSINILIVDDEKKICEILSEILENEGFKPHSALNGANAIKEIEKNGIDLVLLDVKLPDIDGIAILKRIKKINPAVSVIMISAFATVPLAVKALKIGADDFIEKPLEAHRVLTTITNVMKKVELKKQSDALKSEISQKYQIIGKSAEIQKVLSLIDKVASTNSIVLIHGESGVGKEFVARNIHLKSDRVAKPFIKVNCAALPGELIESELFGYEKGAFTGAHKRKPGQFELANQGTLFLDEIGDMSLQAQAKVLRALEENEILRLGGIESIKINVHIIAATNQNLEQLIEQKKFREDLYHRINVLTINVPPLRNRQEDIPLLANNFLKNSCIENNRLIKKLSKNALVFLKHQAWPGNIRELKHLMEKVAVLSDKTIIDAHDIESIIKQAPVQQISHGKKEMNHAKSKFEKEYIIDTLNKTGWRITKTAKILGIDRSTLFRKMKRLRIKK